MNCLVCYSGYCGEKGNLEGDCIETCYKYGLPTVKELEETREKLKKELPADIIIFKSIVLLPDDSEETRTNVEALEKYRQELAANEPIECLELSLRTYNLLRRAGIDTVDKLCNMTLYEAKKVRNMGQKSLAELTEKMEKYGLHFRRLEEQ